MRRFPVTFCPPPLNSIVSCRNRGLKTAITRPIKGSCDTNRNLRDPTKALVGSQNFKLRDRLQNKNSEPKSSALAPIKNNQSQKSRLRLKKKIIRTKILWLWLPPKKIRAKKLGSGSKKNNQSQKARLWLQKKIKA